MARCISKLGRASAAIMVALLAVALGPTTSHGSVGGCDEQRLQTAYMMEDGKRVFDDAKFQVFTIRAQTPAYKSATGQDRLPQALAFDQKLRVSDPGEGTRRLRLRKLSEEDAGWVDRDALLCRDLPLADQGTGLLRRIVIQTETAVQGQVQPRLAYHSPAGVCEGGPASCPKLSRFQWYFVYAEEAGHVLLSEAANLGGRDARLIGWLPEGDGIKWNTAVALRPEEELQKRKGADGTNEAHVCAFPTLEAMKDPKACRPILGGLRWFKIDARLPILRDLGKVYEVAVSSAASTGTFEEAVSVTGVEALKSIDVFFVIDGTKSMQGIIGAIKGRPGFPGVVDQIRDRIKSKVKQGGTVRYGYRIYRDSVKGGKSGVEDEGLALGDKCEPNEEAFVKSFQGVQAVDPPEDTDYPENLFGGLVQASLDFASCPDHLKLVFVIGDHGYEADAQRQRGHRAHDLATVVGRYVRGRRLNTQPVVVFIQGPNEVASAKSPESYSKAYATFEVQATTILKGIHDAIEDVGGTKTAFKADDQFFRMTSRDADAILVERVIKRVDQWLQPDQIGRLAQRLKAGESLVDAITAMQRGDTSNVPILYWNVVADALCKRLGSQCTKQVLEGVFRAYIAHSSDLTHDVLLAQSQLDKWREVLAKYKAFWADLRSGDRQRDRLVNTLMESIGSVLKLDIDDRGKSMGEFAQLVGGLPHGAESKLMAYTPAELRDSRLVATCEIQHLVNYASKKSDIIHIVLDGDKLAVFQADPLPTTACPTLSAKGKAVPHFSGAPRPRALNPPDANTSYSFSFRKGNDRYYWIPVGYLP